MSEACFPNIILMAAAFSVTCTESSALERHSNVLATS